MFQPVPRHKNLYPAPSLHPGGDPKSDARCTCGTDAAPNSGACPRHLSSDYAEYYARHAYDVPVSFGAVQ